MQFVDALLDSFGNKEGEMSTNRFTDEFKRDAVAQVVDWGLGALRSVREPSLSNDRFVDRSGIPASSARSRWLVEAGLLRAIEATSECRVAIYAFDPLHDLLTV